MTLREELRFNGGFEILYYIFIPILWVFCVKNGLIRIGLKFLKSAPVYLISQFAGKDLGG